MSEIVDDETPADCGNYHKISFMISRMMELANTKDADLLVYLLGQAKDEAIGWRMKRLVGGWRPASTPSNDVKKSSRDEFVKKVSAI